MTQETSINTVRSTETGRENAASLAEVDYPGRFFRELAPVHLNYICALNGVRGPKLESAFSYCELGCGSGETVACLAACHPQARFVGIDLSPSHIAQATQLARDGGLTNVTFIEADIARLDFDTLPDFDFITLHGLYAWVPDVVQAAIRDFIAQKLRPGGTCYVSYNAMPGWGSLEPVREFFVDHAARIPGDTLDKVKAALDTLLTLRDQDAPFFRENPAAGKLVDRLRDADPHYVAHEFLSSHARPMYFAEMQNRMATLGLRFVADAAVVSSLPEHSTAPVFVERIASAGDVRERETLHDFIQCRYFRRDIYTRPKPGQAALDSDGLLGPMRFGMIVDRTQVPDTIDVPDAPAIRLEGPWFDRLKALLAERVLTLDEILDALAPDGHARRDLVEGIKLVSAGGFCVPCLTGEVEASAAPTGPIRVIPEINHVRLEQHDWSKASFALASPVTGSDITLNPLEMALLRGLQHSTPLDWVCAALERHGVVLRTGDGSQPLTDKPAIRQALQGALDKFLRHRLPQLVRLGVVAGN